MKTALLLGLSSGRQLVQHLLHAAHELHVQKRCASQPPTGHGPPLKSSDKVPEPGGIPAPSPPQCPTCHAATRSNLDPCPGRLAQPHLSRNDYHYTTKTSKGSHVPTLCHMKLHTMGQEKAQEPTLCLRLPTVMYKIIIRLLSYNAEIWCASVPLLSSGANAAAF